MANTVVTTFTADIGDLKDKTSQAQASLDQLASTAKKAGDSTKAAGSSAKDFGDKAGKAGQSSAKMAGALGLISPAAANASRNLSDLADVGEVAAGMGGTLSIALAGVATVLAGGYLAWKGWNQEAEYNAKISDIAATAQKNLKGIIDDTRISQIAAAVATGRMTEEAGRLETDGVRAMNAFGAATADATKKIKELHAQEGTIGRTLGDMADELRANPLYSGFTAAIDVVDSFTDSSSEADEQIKILMDSEVDANEIIKQGRDARTEEAKATRDSTQATKDDIEAKKLVKAQNEEIAKAIDTYSSALTAKYDQAVENAAFDAEAAADERRWHQETLDYIEEEKKKKEEATKKEIADAEAAQQAKMESTSLYFNAASSMQDAIVSLTTKSYDTTTEEGKKAATKQWKIQHAAAVAQVLASAILGVAQSAQIGYPQNIPGIIASVAQGAASTAAILSTPAPKFHMGSSRVDEMNATLQRGEGVVTSQAMSKAGMREAVQSANAGYDVSGGRQNAQPVQYLHKVYNEFIRDNIKVGSPLTNRIDKNTKVGHRTRK